MRALVCFHDNGGHLLDPLLKRGFRHCFVVVRNGNYWIAIDGCEGVPTVEVVAPSDYDLAKFLRDKGYTVIVTEQRKTIPRSPFVIANCVGYVKSILCLRSTAVTPYGLYKFLRRNR